MSGPISPLPPPSPPSGPTGGSQAPQTTGFSGASSLSAEEEQDIEDLLQLSSLRSFQRNDISINEFWRSQIDTLLTLIEALKEAEIQGNEKFWESFLLLNLDQQVLREELVFTHEQHELILTNIEDNVDDLNSGQSDVTDATTTYGTEQDNIEASEPEVALNNAIDTFNTEIAGGTPYGTAVVALNAAIDQYNNDIAAYNAAAQAFNDEIDAYNTLIAAYNGNAQLVEDTINPERDELGVPPLEGVPLFSQIPASYKVDLVDTVDTLDPMVQEPPPPHQTINAPERTPLTDGTGTLLSAANAIGTTNVDNPTSGQAEVVEAAVLEYNTDLDAVRDAADAVNEIVLEMEEADDNGEPLTDLANQYNTVIISYNTAVGNYNASRTALENEITTYNGLIDTYNTAFDDLVDNPDVYFPPAGFGTLSEADLPDGSPLPGLVPLDPQNPVVPDRATDVNNNSNYSEEIDFNVNGNIFDVPIEFYLDVFNTLLSTVFTPGSEPTNVIELVNLFGDDATLLSIILMKRGQPTSSEFDPDLSKESIGATSPSATSLSNIIFGLGSSSLTTALDNANLSKQFNNIFEELNQKVPRNLVANVSQVLFSSLLNTGIFNIRPSTQLAQDLALQKGVESVPVTLALNAGLIQTLSGAINSGAVRDALGKVIAATGGLGELSPLQRDNLISSLTNLSIFSLLSIGVADLASATQNRKLVLDSLSTNLAFSLSDNLVDVREQLKAIREEIGDQRNQQLQESVTRAFIAALEQSGLPSDKAAIQGEQIAEGVFSGENPTPAVLEQAGGNVATILSTILLLAVFNPEQALDESESAFREVQTEAGRKALEGIGLTEQDKENLLNIAEEKRYLLEIVANLLPGLEGTDIQTIYNTLSSVQVTSSIEERLSGEIGKSQAQILAKRAMNSINSVQIILEDVLLEEVKNKHFDDVDRLTRSFKESIDFETDPATYLTEFLSPAKNWLRFSGMVETGEGLPQPVGGTLSGVARGGLDIAV